MAIYFVAYRSFLQGGGESAGNLVVETTIEAITTYQDASALQKEAAQWASKLCGQPAERIVLTSLSRLDR